MGVYFILFFENCNSIFHSCHGGPLLYHTFLFSLSDSGEILSSFLESFFLEENFINNGDAEVNYNTCHYIWFWDCHWHPSFPPSSIQILILSHLIWADLDGLSWPDLPTLVIWILGNHTLFESMVTWGDISGLPCFNMYDFQFYCLKAA